MAEVTDSFCERCGTKYVFAPSGPRSFSLKGARVLARGLRNFVLTDGQSIADANATGAPGGRAPGNDARGRGVLQDLNFCMSCRQYACDRCWNASAGACLSCSPVLEPEAELAARPTVFADGAPKPRQPTPPRQPGRQSICRITSRPHMLPAQTTALALMTMRPRSRGPSPIKSPPR